VAEGRGGVKPPKNAAVGFAAVGFAAVGFTASGVTDPTPAPPLEGRGIATCSHKDTVKKKYSSFFTNEKCKLRAKSRELRFTSRRTGM